MGNENSKDGEGGEQPEEEGPPGSHKDAQSKLPNGDVGTSSGEPDAASDVPGPEGEGEEPRESTEVDEHTKRMTIISENVYHYVGLVAGREYAREKGLTPKEGQLPVAPLGFMRPEKKKEDKVKANDTKTVSEPGKPTIDEKLPKETLEAGKEVDSPAMELPRFYQPPKEDKNKATEKSSKAPDASDGKAKDKAQEKDDKVGKTEVKPEKEADSLQTELPRFYQSKTTDKEKAPGESKKPTDVSSSKTQEKDDKERAEKKENGTEKEVKAEKEMDLHQSDRNKAIGEPGKSELPNGETEEKIGEKDKKVEKLSKGALESKPEKEVNTPATKIPRFQQPPNEDKKKAGGESGKSESKEVSNGMPEGKTQEKSEKVDKIETAEMELPRFYQTPSEEKTKTAEEPDKSDLRDVLNGDAKTKTDQKNGKLENKPEKETKMELPRFYPEDSNEDKPETDSDSTTKRYSTALTVGPRTRKTEEPKRKIPVAINFLTVGGKKNEENKAVEQDVAERTVQKEEETLCEKVSLGSLEASTKDPEPTVTQSKSAEKKEKSVRFEDRMVEAVAPSTEKKRVISMMYVAPVRSTKNEEQAWFAAPVELTSTPPPTSAESKSANDDEACEDDDPIPMCGEALLRQADKHRRGFYEDEDDLMNATWAPEEEDEEKQTPDTTIIVNNGKSPTMNSEYDDPDVGEEIITPKSASGLYSSSSTVAPSQSSLQRIHDVEEGAPDYDVHHLKQPVPRSPEVDLGSGKILNAPSILMGSSITLSTNRQKCETLPQETSDDGSVAVRIKTKPSLKETRVKSSRRVDTVSPEDSVDSERASDNVHASVQPLMMNQPDSGKSLCDNYTQTSDLARKDKPSGGPLVVRSRSVGFQGGAGEPKRTIATLKRPSLPSSDSRPVKPPETEKKTRIPLAARSSSHPETRPALPEARSTQPVSRSALPEPRKGKGSPLPERKISVLRKDVPTTKISPRTPPATNDSRNHKELAKRSSLPVQDSRGCSGHPVTPRVAAASPRVVRKKDDSKCSPMHKTSASSKSMDSIPRCTCLQLTGKDSSLNGDKTLARHPSNPLGLREYDFTPPSKKPHWR